MGPVSTTFISPLANAAGRPASSFIPNSHSLTKTHAARTAVLLPNISIDVQAIDVQSQPTPSSAPSFENGTNIPINNAATNSTSQRLDASVPSNAVPYFAYFSNMNPYVMGPLSKSPLRKFDVYKTLPAVLRGYKLTFNVPGIPPEPAFANITPDSNQSVYGVIHWISPADFFRLALSEGVRPDDFPLDLPLLPQFSSILDAEASLIDDQASKVSIRTFQFHPPNVPEPLQAILKPSRRYVTTAIDGARHFGLPRQFIASLQTIKNQPNVFAPFGLPVPQRPHLLDRPNPDFDFGKATSEMYSPFSPIRARNAVEIFEKNEPRQADGKLRLLRISNTRSCRGKLRRPLYFLPGIDGTGKSILSQMEDMDRAGVYDVHSLVYPFANRQSLPELAESIADLIKEDADGRSVTIIAESMGGLMGLMLAKENVRRKRAHDGTHLDIDLLLLINPATCYSRAMPNDLWDFLLGIGLSEEQYAALLPPVMLPFVVDLDSMRENLGPSIAPRLQKMLGALSRVSDVLPQDSLNHRLRILKEFSFSKQDYDEIGSELGPTDIALISAMNDNLIPSLSENYRMRRSIPNIYTMVLPFGGHAPMFDVRFSLDKFLQPFKMRKGKTKPEQIDETLSPALLRRREALKKKFATNQSQPGPLDKKTRQELRVLKDFLAQSIRESSPVFIGEENIPDRVEGKPVLFVSNHTLLGWYDAMHPVLRILESKEVLVRSLGHPTLLEMTVNQFPGTTKFTAEDLDKFGVVKITPRSTMEQMARGNWTLLFPGGAREALKQPSEPKYSVIWPENPEFIRPCALFGATIIPVSTVGTEDMVNLVLDSKTGANIFGAISKLVGGPVDYDIPRIDPATQWRNGDKGSDFPLFPPLGFPAGTQRLYYRFGKPLTIPPEAVDDKALTKELYCEIRSRVVEGVEILKKRREADMFRSLEKRKEFKKRYGESLQPPAGLGWAWSQGEDGYLDDELQPPL